MESQSSSYQKLPWIKRIIILVIGIITPQILIAQESAGNGTEHKIIAAQESRFSAISADINTLQNLLTDEMSYAHTTGWTETKSDFLNTIESKKIDYLSIDSKDLEVRIYENTAVITGLADVKLLVRDEIREFTIRFLEVDRQVDDSWKLVAWQSVKNLDN